jgi:hypothetical protein
VTLAVRSRGQISQVTAASADYPRKLQDCLVQPTFDVHPDSRESLGQPDIDSSKASCHSVQVISVT